MDDYGKTNTKARGKKHVRKMKKKVEVALRKVKKTEEIREEKLERLLEEARHEDDKE